MLTKAEFSKKANSVTKCGDKRCKCCDHLLLGSNYRFKNSNKDFVLKSPMNCDSSNLIYVIICPTCKEEYIGETGAGKTKLRDRVRVHREQINHPEYQTANIAGHLRECGKGSFKIFPFLQMRSDSTELRRSYEHKFQLQFKTKLNNV